MGGIYIDMEAFKVQAMSDAYHLFGAAGVELFVAALIAFQPRKSFWQRLKDEIVARPRVF